MMNENQTKIAELANRTTRSTVAVIDTVAARGGFRGEELATIGQLRDQCIQLIQLAEQEADSDEGEDFAEK
jgi:hypothetical protein|tara:strand:- start:3208 stop:3420 length:213 start_codon:yes stop_codon:yes gene_type:complete